MRKVGLVVIRKQHVICLSALLIVNRMLPQKQRHLICNDVTKLNFYKLNFILKLKNDDG